MTTPRKRAPGGGRPPLVPGGMRRGCVTLSLADWAYLRSLDSGNVSAAVRRLVQEHREQSNDDE